MNFLVDVITMPIQLISNVFQSNSSLDSIEVTHNIATFQVHLFLNQNGWVKITDNLESLTLDWNEVLATQKTRKNKKTQIFTFGGIYYLQLKDGILQVFYTHPKVNKNHPLLSIMMKDCISSPVPETLRVGQIFDRSFPILIKNLVNGNTFYLYFATNMEKEDWYLALRSSSKTFKPNAGHLAKIQKRQLDDAALLAKDLANTVPDHVKKSYLEGDSTTQWFNALVGRIWNSISHSEKFKLYLETLLIDTLQKQELPNMISKLELRSLHFGMFFN